MIERFCRVGFLLFFALAAISTAAASPSPGGDVGGNIAQRENSFGFALLHAVDDRSGNVFLSPLSIGQAMTMLYDGGAGVTQDQIGHALGFGGLDASAVNDGARELRAGIAGADPSVDLSIANALWANHDIEFRSSYAQTCSSIFDAQATSLNFKDPSAATTINSWVSRNTKGKITSIVSPGSIRQAGAVLTDAVYFHGAWAHPFHASDTQDGAFTLGSGGTKQLPLMHQIHSFPVTQNDLFQAVRLPYGNGRIGMVIVLPRSGQSLDSLAEGLTNDKWRQMMSSMTLDSVDLTLPRFHVDYSTSLVDGLKSLGIEDAFDKRNADFSPMSETPMYVSAVEHKTTLDVDEAGTTATAATAITMTPMLAAPVQRPPIVIRVDHPFLCAIVDNQTGALLFVGFIRDPGEVSGSG